MSVTERRRQIVNSRAKGKRGELEAVHILRAHGWPDAQRNTIGRRQVDGDILYGPAATHIEVKRKRVVDICSSLDQIWRDADPLKLPLLAHRSDGFKWLATLPREDFDPLRELWDGTLYRKPIPQYKKISVCRVHEALSAETPAGWLAVVDHKPAQRHPWMTTLQLERLLALLWLRERG